MASLAEREGLRGKVQCIYFDPPYGIKFNSNFQWSTTSRDVKDGNAAHITREPEQVKAFRDTWRDGIHSYLTYLRDRLTVARDLLTESGSIFVQIGDENVHRVRGVLDEVFGPDNFVSEITFRKTASLNSPMARLNTLGAVSDYVLWYARRRETVKYRQVFTALTEDELGGYSWTEGHAGLRPLRSDERPEQGGRVSLSDTSSMGAQATFDFTLEFQGTGIRTTPGRHWSTTEVGLQRLARANRLHPKGIRVFYKRSAADFPVRPLANIWDDTQFGGYLRDEKKVYVVQTLGAVVQRCLLLATDPGDLVVDPTCGSGTTASVAEQWARRWITIDTSRVALTLARARIMGARYPCYMLADSPEGLRKEAQVSGRAFVDRPTHGTVRHGFVYERVPHITLKSIANDAEIDVIHQEQHPRIQAALDKVNAALRGHKRPYRVTSGGRQGEDVRFDAPNDATFTMPSGEVVSASALVEWEVPREAPADWPEAAQAALHDFWEARIARQKAIDTSIAAKAEFEYLYDQPYEDKKKVRVAGPFTVESLSPHRTLAVGADDELIDPSDSRDSGSAASAVAQRQSYELMILENLKAAGVQQAHKGDRIVFESVEPWPGELVCGEGRYREGPSTSLGASEKRAGIFIGPEFGTVGRADLVRAAREAGDAGFDVLIACAFNYEAHASEFDKLGRIRVLKARMNADLHMAGDLKATSTANLFVIFGEPDIDILHESDGEIRVHVKGVDVFDPGTGEVRSDGPAGIACWFIDTDYNEESFFVRHAYFLGQNDPYSALRTTLKAEINADAWETLHSEISRPFDKPASGRIAVKVINHLGDEVMKVFRVE
jgi:adenine-specific DNA-methyltransferase